MDSQFRFIALGEYELDRPVSKINTCDIQKLESMVLSRSLWIVKYEWMKQFLPSRCKGITRMSSWDNSFRYARKDKLPNITDELEVEKGRLYFTKGVDLKFFYSIGTT